MSEYPRMESPLLMQQHLSLPPNSFVSPSLVNAFARGETAYEMKFLLNPAQAAEVVAWARQHLVTDPFADLQTGAYTIQSLYLDTDDLQIYQRRGSYARCKYRLRRYNQSDSVFLERKMKQGEQVRKRRTEIPAAELQWLDRAESGPEWEGRWFQQRILLRHLKPVCLLTYERLAFVGAGEAGPVRLTLDQAIRCVPQRHYALIEPASSLPLLPDQIILELKYRRWLPSLFKRLAAELRLMPRTVSKYRRGLQAWNLDGGSV